ncbi:2Fe-2S iron-sulfur cluster-binding protein [Streptomyces sp. NPDC047061]|uniref:2Fe-2S iron-sulfur cluster-binding protein n=1 Tax=Streptomyces sp. NPDC047061 TaxID=3154605 RepID=UPI0033C839B6
MPTIHYICPDGSRRDVEAAAGLSVMEAAVKQGVPGLIAECGGAAACATCHVYVDEKFAAAVGEADDIEAEMLDDAMAERRPTSRLACQIEIGDALDGMEIEIAAVQ